MNTKSRMKLRAVGRAKPLRIVSRQTKPHASVAAYMIALSQTDTMEQARWMAALGRRPSLARTRS